MSQSFLYNKEEQPVPKCVDFDARYSLKLCKMKTVFLFIIMNLFLFYSVASYLQEYNHEFYWFYIVSLVLSLTIGAFLFYKPPSRFRILFKVVIYSIFGFTVYWLFKNPIKLE
jgi:hypothetical protein